MARVSLKKVAQKGKTFIERAQTPYARKIDEVMPLEVISFEKHSNDLTSVVGIDMRSGKAVRVLRAWSAANREKFGENPLIHASKRLAPGSVMLFTDTTQIKADKALKGANGDVVETYSSKNFLTIANEARNEGAEIIYDEPMFVDAVSEDPAERAYQVYNTLEVEKARPVSGVKDFARAVLDWFETKPTEDDSLLLRGYSTDEKMAASIRILIEPEDDFDSIIQKVFTQAQFIDLLGSEEGTYEISGAELMETLSDSESDTQWEIIPIQGRRKTLASDNNPEMDEILEKRAGGLFRNFTYLTRGASVMHGFHQAVLGIKQRETGRGIFSDIVSVFHDEAAARPLALVPTKLFPDLADRLGYGKASPDQSAPALSEKSDNVAVSALVSEVLGERADTFKEEFVLDIQAVELGDATPEPETQNADGADPFAGDEFLIDIDSVSLAPEGEDNPDASAPEVAAVSEEIVETAEDPFGEDADFNIDLDALSADPEPAAEPEMETQGDDVSGADEDFDIDLDALSLEPEASEEDPFGEDVDFDIDLDSLSAEPEPAAEPEVAPVSASQSEELTAIHENEDPFGEEEFIDISELYTSQQEAEIEEEIVPESVEEASATQEKIQDSAPKSAPEPARDLEMFEDNGAVSLGIDDWFSTNQTPDVAPDVENHEILASPAPSSPEESQLEDLLGDAFDQIGSALKF